MTHNRATRSGNWTDVIMRATLGLARETERICTTSQA